MAPERSFGFLRAINVGKRRMAMTNLVDALLDAVLSDVETFIASGNCVVTGQGWPACTCRNVNTLARMLERWG
jgi:hypothetical protein